MDRRNVLGYFSAGAAAGCASLFSGNAPLQAAAQPGAEPRRGLPPLKITDIRRSSRRPTESGS